MNWAAIGNGPRKKSARTKQQNFVRLCSAEPGQHGLALLPVARRITLLLHQYLGDLRKDDCLDSEILYKTLHRGESARPMAYHAVQGRAQRCRKRRIPSLGFFKGNKTFVHKLQKLFLVGGNLAQPLYGWRLFRIPLHHLPTPFYR
jgi:hypothetical protein